MASRAWSEVHAIAKRHSDCFDTVPGTRPAQRCLSSRSPHDDGRASGADPVIELAYVYSEQLRGLERWQTCPRLGLVQGLDGDERHQGLLLIEFVRSACLVSWVSSGRSERPAFNFFGHVTDGLIEI